MIGSRAAAFATAIAVSVVASGGSAVAQTGADWTAYLANVAHSSVSSDSTVTPSRVGALAQAWSWKPPSYAAPRPPNTLYATPAVVNGVVYVAAHTGVFYALSLATGKVLWQHDLSAYQPARS